jgi:uncharacterized protein (TIGR01244 family)
MNIRHLTPDFAVTGQIVADDVSAIVAQGFKSLICNRPDNEEANQPGASGIEKAARGAGLGYSFIPVVSGALTDDNARDMAGALKALPRPILAYCRSGARCANLYQLAIALTD